MNVHTTPDIIWPNAVSISSVFMLSEILAKHTGKTVDEINEATLFDNYMNADEAVAFGICDSIRDLF